MNPETMCMGYDRTIVWVRWAALWLDIIVRVAVIALMVVFSNPNSLVMSVCLAILFYILYYPLLEGLTGQTFGKWVCRLRVVDANGNRPGVLKAIIRTLLRLVEINPLLFGGVPAGIAVACSSKRQRLGDMAANTYVIKTADHDWRNKPEEQWRSAYDLSPTRAPGPELGSGKGPRVLLVWALLLIIPGVSLLNSGIVGKGLEARNRGPITMTGAQFFRSPMKPGWYHITDCSLDLTQAIWETYKYSSTAAYNTDDSTSKDGPITDVYLPVFANADTKKAGLVIATQSEQYKAIVDEIRGINDKDETAIRKWLLANRDRILVNRDFTGTVKEGSSFNDITTLAANVQGRFDVAPRFGILTEGDAPYRGNPDTALALGAIFTLAAGLFWIGPWRRRG